MLHCQNNNNQYERNNSHRRHVKLSTPTDQRHSSPTESRATARPPRSTHLWHLAVTNGFLRWFWHRVNYDNHNYISFLYDILHSRGHCWCGSDEIAGRCWLWRPHFFSRSLSFSCAGWLGELVCLHVLITAHVLKGSFYLNISLF